MYTINYISLHVNELLWKALDRVEPTVVNRTHWHTSHMLSIDDLHAFTLITSRYYNRVRFRI